MKNIKAIFMGTPEFAVLPLSKLIETCEVIAVVTQPDKPGNRGKTVFSPVKELAIQRGINVLQPVNIKDDFEGIIALDVDIIITCAYGQIIPKDILDVPKYGCINIHASLLPKLRGGAPIHRSIINGEKETGVTIMYMDEKMDEGNMILKEAITINDSDTVGSIHDKLSVLGSKLLKESLVLIIKGENDSIPQNHKEATYAYNLKKEDELIDFNNNMIEVFNRIRGLDPFPGSYAMLDDKVVKFYKVQKSNIKASIPGKIIDISNDRMFISCKDYVIIIEEIKYEGSRKMTVKEFFNGRDKKDYINKIFNKD